MKKIILMLAALSLAGIAPAALKPGDSLTPYTIKNVENGKEYCQVCAYSAKAAKIVAFGNLNDEAFWADLKKLQALQNGQGKLGVFAQILDSKDINAIKAMAAKNGITFPVVVAAEKNWDEAYHVKGVSRTIYYAQKNRIAWTSVGLNDKASGELEASVRRDLAS
jgi:hypothetical protein